MRRGDILDTAKQAVMVDRAATHGAAERSFDAIAAHWTAHLAAAHGCHVTLTGHDVALMMVLMKVVRAGGNPLHRDNWVDIAGYAACGGELANPVQVMPAEIAFPSVTELALAARQAREQLSKDLKGVPHE